MTDPFSGRRILATNWPAHPTASTPPAVIKVPEREETDVRELADLISSLTASERERLRSAIAADAAKRSMATLTELNGTPWNKWCYLTGLRYGPAFAASVFAEEESEHLVEVFVGRASREGWNVREAETGIRNGLRAATNAETNFTVRELSKMRQRDAALATVLGTTNAPAVADAGVKTAGQLILEQLQEQTKIKKVLWSSDNYRTFLTMSWAFAAGSKDRVFASSTEGRLSMVGLGNGRHTAENFLTADHVKEMLQRAFVILEPATYEPANEPGAVAADRVPSGAALIKTVVDGPRRGEKAIKSAWTCEGVADAYNAAAVLTVDATGKPRHDPETTVWLPMEKWDGLILKLAIERIMATLDGVTLQELLGVFQGPQMLPTGTVVTASGLHIAREATARAAQEVAFIDVGEVAGMLELMPPHRAKAVLKGFIDLFTYAEPEDGAVLTAFAVTGFCRLAFKLAPLTLIDAPIFGAGKTFAAERIAGLSGTPASVIACTNKSRDSGDEMRKRIETVLLTGQAGVQILDDVPGGELPNVESFRTVLTANEGKCQIRVLGENRQIGVKPDKFTWVATGNNVRVTEDMVRRSIHARLDRDKAEARGWVGEAKARAALDRIKNEPKARAEVVSAVLSLLHHVRQNGPALPPLSNFEGWSELPREVAYLVMGADPVATQARLRQNDEKAIEHAEITEALLALIGSEADTETPVSAYGTPAGFVLAHDIAARIAGAGELPSFVAPGPVPDYIQELRRHFDAKDPRELHNRLSAWLRQHKDRRTASDEQGVSRAVVCRKVRDPKQRKMRDHWGVKVCRLAETRVITPWARHAAQ